MRNLSRLIDIKPNPKIISFAKNWTDVCCVPLHEIYQTRVVFRIIFKKVFCYYVQKKKKKK